MNKPSNSYYAEQIKSQIGIVEALKRYGFCVNQSGRMPCPLHGGKNPNFAIKSNYWHCFKCGKSGDLISFVQEYFNLSFRDALVKINQDFSIGLPIGERVSRSKQLQMAKSVYDRARAQREIDIKKSKLDEEYEKAFAEYLRLEQQKREFAPTGYCDLHSKYIEAIKELPHASYTLDCIEIERSLFNEQNKH